MISCGNESHMWQSADVASHRGKIFTRAQSALFRLDISSCQGGFRRRLSIVNVKSDRVDSVFSDDPRVRPEIWPRLAPNGLDFEFIAISVCDINRSKPIRKLEDLVVQHLLDPDEEYDDE